MLSEDRCKTASKEGTQRYKDPPIPPAHTRIRTEFENVEEGWGERQRTK